MTDITTNRVSTDRLNQIARAIAGGNYRELTMRIPAEPDRDADLVISAAADEIDRLRAEVATYGADIARLRAEGEEMRDTLRQWRFAEDNNDRDELANARTNRDAAIVMTCQDVAALVMRAMTEPPK